jgi:hypothetical protein
VVDDDHALAVQRADADGFAAAAREPVGPRDRARPQLVHVEVAVRELEQRRAELVLARLGILLDQPLGLERAQEPVGRPLGQAEPLGEVGHPQPALAAGQRAKDRRRSLDGLDSHDLVPLLPNQVRQCRIDRCMNGDER